MQFDVDIRLYEYWHEQVKIRKKSWNIKEIKKFYWKYICKQKVRKKVGGKYVPRAPVMYLCVRGIDFASYYFFSYHTTTRPNKISIGLGVVSTVWYFFHITRSRPFSQRIVRFFYCILELFFSVIFFFFILLLNN